ncbi:hypothetical protein H4S06_002180 [Coemansia sp. BCRC 34490]|nr:hypothetical protein H4S06_002180 [Coemansia sp. BCRC 34490]
MEHHGIVFDRSHEGPTRRSANAKQVSWRRLRRIFTQEHGFIGPRLYMSMLHAAAGVFVWATGIYTGSLALMSYSFMVLFDATSLFIDLLPRALEYSGNDAASVEYAFGLRVLPAVLEFANSLGLLFRGIQALKEGVEHLVTSSHEHSAAAMEFETYAHQTPQHNRGGAPLALAAALAAVAATVCSAARFANHRGLWELCRSPLAPMHMATQAQNVTLNPINAASVLAGVWMVYMAVLVPPAEESAIEPVSCVLVAVVMAAIGASACLHLGRLLLHATTRESAESVRRVVALVSSVPGVVGCERVHAWSPVVGERAGMLRVVVDERRRLLDAAPGAGASVSALRQIQAILQSYGLGAWTLDIRNAASSGYAS